MDRRDFLKLMGGSTLYLALSGCRFMQADTPQGTSRSEAATRNSGEVQYRILPHGGIKISTIGLGSGSLGESSAAEIADIMSFAAERGINIMDTVMSDFTPAAAIGAALKGRRNKFSLQMHKRITM